MVDQKAKQVFIEVVSTLLGCSVNIGLNRKLGVKVEVYYLEADEARQKLERALISYELVDLFRLRFGIEEKKVKMSTAASTKFLRLFMKEHGINMETFAREEGMRTKALKAYKKRFDNVAVEYSKASFVRYEVKHNGKGCVVLKRTGAAERDIVDKVWINAAGEVFRNRIQIGKIDLKK